MTASPGVDRASRSTGRALAALVLILAVAGCGGSPASPSPSLSPTTSPRATLAPTPTPTPEPTPTPAPIFVATGSMHDARMDATATLLSDGKVLIAGGSPAQMLDDPVLASAELYDPVTGKFTLTGSMTTARSGATATLLPDGRVLIAGGWGCPTTKTCSADDARQGNGGGSLASAELYDPATGKFRRTGSMLAARYDATATLLPDGRVLMAGGQTQVVEVYDPSTGRFTRAGSVLTYYDIATAILLPNGKVLLVGPVATGGPGAELYDPTSGKSTSISLVLPPGAVAAATSNGYDETATLLKDGRVLLCTYGYLVTYDPPTGSFTQSGSTYAPAQWNGPTTTLLPDGRVLFAGGYTSPFSGELAATAGLYDPATGFHPIESMNLARAEQTATLLPDGTVLIAGGLTNPQNVVPSAELFKP